MDTVQDNVDMDDILTEVSILELADSSEIKSSVTASILTSEDLNTGSWADGSIPEIVVSCEEVRFEEKK